MNKTFLEFALRAGIMQPERFDSIDGGNQLKTFAQLIVNKCTTIARNTDLEDIDGGDSAVLNAVATQIEDYFGVKN